MLKRIGIMILSVWLLTAVGVAIYGYWPQFQPLPKKQAATKGKKVDLGQATWQRVSHEPLLLIGAGAIDGAAVIAAIWFVLYLRGLQERNGKQAAANSISYQILMETSDVISIAATSEAYYLLRPSFASTSWQRMTGKYPYLVLTYVGRSDTPYLTTCIVTIVGNLQLQQLVYKTIEALGPNIELRQVPCPLPSERVYHAWLKLARESYHNIRIEQPRDPLINLMSSLVTNKAITYAAVSFFMRYEEGKDWAVAGQKELEKAKGVDPKQRDQQKIAKLQKNLRSDKYGWKVRPLVAVGYEQDADQAALERLGNLVSYFGSFDDDNCFVAEPSKYGHPGFGYPADLSAGRDVLGPLEAGTVVHPAYPTIAPGLASRGARLMRPSRNMIVVDSVPLVGNTPQYKWS